MENHLNISNINISNTCSTNPCPLSPSQSSRPSNSPKSPVNQKNSHSQKTSSKHVSIEYQPVILRKNHSSREHCFPPPLIGLGWKELHISCAPPHLRDSLNSGSNAPNYNFSDSRNFSHGSPPPPPSGQDSVHLICQYLSREISDEPNRRNHPSGTDDVERNYDGPIHGIRNKKFGPYICSKCNKGFPTSQHLASHVSHEHYKIETEDERRKRREDRMSRRRQLRLQQVNDGITLVPVSSQDEIGNQNPEEVARGGGNRYEPSMKVEEHGVQGNDGENKVIFNNVGGVRIKREHYA